MYPNYSPYQPGQPSGNPHNKPPSSNQSYQPPSFNQGFLSPQGLANNKNVYASTIQASTSSSNLKGGFGLGKLQGMGRMIKEQPDMTNHKSQEDPFYQTAHNLNFKSNNDKGKLASSVIFQKNVDDDFNRFPGFNIQNNQGGGKLDAMLAKKKSNEQPQQDIHQSAQERRKRQILSIKQQLQVLNKRMYKGQGDSKPYFQLSSRRNTTNQLPQHQMVQEHKNIQGQINSSDPYQGNKSLFHSFSHQSSEGVKNHNQIQEVSTKIQNISRPMNYTSPVEPPKTEGGMFKKKNPYLTQQVSLNDHKPKAFLLSPKGGISANMFKANNEPISHSIPSQPISQKTASYEYKPAQNIEPVSSNFNKGMKRTESFSTENTVQQHTPKQFKRSDFKVGKKMGKGQFGQVMLVQHKQTGFLCGMKVMSKKQIRQQKYVNQVARELSIQFFLNHRNVAPLYGYFSDEQNVYLLVEFCTGGQLLEMLRKKHRMEEEDTSPIIREICQGLDYIHKEQIIHRDIKPENILFNFNTVKICDFGWAVHCGTGMRKTVSGSPLYYSPEVVMETQYDQKVDIWAVGMMTYECLLGKIPFKIYSELDLNRIVEDEVKFPEYVDVSDLSKDFILGIMKKNPQDRMSMKDIFKHEFIKKYMNKQKVPQEVIEDFRRVLN